MATRTPYYGLTKPAGIEDAQISVINANMDTLDTELHLTTVRDAKNLAPIYDATSSYVEGDYVTYLVTGQSSQDANGYFVFKCIDDTTEPAGNFDTNKWEAVCITDEMGSGGGGGGEGGHIFLDDAGTAMPQRAKAKFEGAYSTDNSADGITNVAVLRTMSGIEFEQLSDAEKQGMIYVDDETTGTDDKFQPVIYSTEEREIGVWTDGKPLYQRTLQGTVNVISTSRNWYTILPVSSLPNLDNVVPIDGSYIIDSGDGQVYPIPMTTGISQGASTSCVYNTSEGLRVCLEGVSAGTSNYSITLQYTKTTDTAGSGQWTPQGVPAVHYSTDEKVVGTWIDGNTLYERFVTIPNISIASGSGDWRYKDIIITSYMSDVNIDYIALNVDASYYEVGNDTYSFLGARCSQRDKEIVVCTLFTVSDATLHLCVRYTKASS